MKDMRRVLDVFEDYLSERLQIQQSLEKNPHV